MTRCARHPNSIMVVDCAGCREAVRTAARLVVRPDCGAPQPNRSAACERSEGHDGEHRAELTPGHTYCYWQDGGVVETAVVFGGWRD